MKKPCLAAIIVLGAAAAFAADPALDAMKKGILYDIDVDTKLLADKRACVETAKNEEDIQRCQDDYYREYKLKRMGQAGKAEAKSGPKLKPGVKIN